VCRLLVILSFERFAKTEDLIRNPGVSHQVKYLDYVLS